MLSQNPIISCNVKNTCYVGHFLSVIEVSLEYRFHCTCNNVNKSSTVKPVAKRHSDEVAPSYHGYFLRTVCPMLRNLSCRDTFFRILMRSLQTGFTVYSTAKYRQCQTHYIMS